ncbi:MAG: hypothetical protein ABIE36_02730 [Candidatus Diapherotrites archaeon]
MLNNKLNKKAQVGETITWVVATIIIIFILLTSVYVSILLGKIKSIKSSPKLDLGESSIDWIDVKTEIAYKINNKNKDKIENWISQENEEESDSSLIFGGGEFSGGGAGGEY